jgi:hypothetical protein
MTTPTTEITMTTRTTLKATSDAEDPAGNYADSEDDDGREDEAPTRTPCDTCFADVVVRHLIQWGSTYCPECGRHLWRDWPAQQV